MLKLLVVEDEEIERNMLVANLKWEDIGIEIIGAVSCASDALSIIENQHTDLLLTDINMSGISGIELAEMIFQKYPEIKIVFLSGHQEFEYAVAAIKFKAVRYLTKPVALDELTSLMKDIVQLCITEHKQKYEQDTYKQQLKESLPLLQEKFYKELAYGELPNNANITERTIFLGISLPEKDILVSVIEIDDYAEIGKKLDEYCRRLMDFEVLNAINESIDGNEFRKVLFLNEGRYLLLFALKTGFEYKTTASRIAEKIIKFTNLRCSVSITIGVGGVADCVEQVPLYFKRALEAVNYKLFLGKNQVVFLDDIAPSRNKIILEIEKFQKDIINGIKMGDENIIKATLDDMFSKILESKSFDLHYIRNIAVSVLTNSLLAMYEIGYSTNDIFNVEYNPFERLVLFETIQDIRAWIESIMSDACKKVAVDMCRKNSRITANIKSIINSRYGEDLTVEGIANEIHLSAGYATTIFKKEAGESISRHLIKVRVQKAMEMLRDENSRVYEIAEKVGYKNLTHFSYIFKSIMGISPREYKENILK